MAGFGHCDLPESGASASGRTDTDAMPLDSYGVLVGTLTGHHRDTPDDQGRWFHVNLDVDAPAPAIAERVEPGVERRLRLLEQRDALEPRGLCSLHRELTRRFVDATVGHRGRHCNGDGARWQARRGLREPVRPENPVPSLLPLSQTHDVLLAF